MSQNKNITNSILKKKLSLVAKVANSPVPVHKIWSLPFPAQPPLFFQFFGFGPASFSFAHSSFLPPAAAALPDYSPSLRFL
jgi:hypothetical protein